MKNLYVAPKMEIVELDLNATVTTSVPGDECPGVCVYNFTQSPFPGVSISC